MRMIAPVTVDDTNLESTTATVAVDEVIYGTDWKGEWSSSYNGGYSTGDVVYKSAELYESLTSSNTSDPATSSTGTGATWLHLGKTNPWRMFDDFVNTQTIGPSVDVGVDSEITFIIEQNTIEHLAFFELDARYITVRLLDAVDTVLSEETYDLYAHVEDVIDWYEYFFGNDTLPRQATIIQLPWVTYEERIKVVITQTSAPAKCGNFSMGRGYFLGSTQWQPEVSILDYSKKDTDSFGRTYLNQGNYSTLIRARLVLDNELFDSTKFYLERNRGTALVWNFNEEDTSWDGLLIYGFYRDFRMILDSPGGSICILDVQGLI